MVPIRRGAYVDDHAALGIRRLRIIDLVTGEQPQCDEGRTVDYLRGEIYNFAELREELSEQGTPLPDALGRE